MFAKALLIITRIARKGWSAGAKSSRWRIASRLLVKVSGPRMGLVCLLGWVALIVVARCVCLRQPSGSISAAC